MMFYYTELHLCKSSGSRAVSVELNVNFNFKTHFIFEHFHKNGIIKSCSPF
jgi:hypothetical protein